MDYAALVQELGGECIDLDYYTNSCTHLVVGECFYDPYAFGSMRACVCVCVFVCVCVCVCVAGRVSRTEKFLGACAGGKWVLHKSYLEACRVERRFVEVSTI